MAPENFVRAVTLIGAAVCILATLTACSHQPPAHLTIVKQAVDSSMTYVDYNAKAPAFDCVTLRESHVKPAHLKAHEGNCYDYAIAYRKAVGRGTVVKERRADGTDHAFMAVDGWRLDVKYPYPVPFYHSGCPGR
jgi:hypothetical protein